MEEKRVLPGKPNSMQMNTPSADAQIQDLRSHFEEAATLTEIILKDEDFIKKVGSSGRHIASALAQGKKIMSCGNGGSMCDAMHFAEELSGRYREDRPALAAMSCHDPSHLTCVGNDYGFQQVFQRWVEALGQPGDVLVAISTSGRSENVLAAAKAARDCGMTVIGLTGKDGGPLAALCHHEIRVPWNGFADRIQEVHIKIIHSWIDLIEKSLTRDQSIASA